MEPEPLRLVPEISHVFTLYKSKAVKVRVVRADSAKVKGTVRIPLKEKSL
jgi:hypothetical protein